MNKSDSRPSTAWRQLAWSGLGWLLGALALAGGVSLLSQIEGDVQHAQAATESQRA